MLFHRKQKSIPSPHNYFTRHGYTNARWSRCSPSLSPEPATHKAQDKIEVDRDEGAVSVALKIVKVFTQVGPTTGTKDKEEEIKYKAKEKNSYDEKVETKDQEEEAND